MCTELQNESTGLVLLATKIDSFDSDFATNHYDMKNLITKSNNHLNNGGDIPDAVTELLIRRLYNYLLQIEDGGVNSGALANALYLSGENHKKIEIESREFARAFREGFTEAEKADRAPSLNAEDIKNRVNDYLEAGCDPNDFFKIEGAYLAQSGKKIIRPVDLGKIFSVYFNVKLKTASEYYKKYDLPSIEIDDIRIMKPIPER